jgi:hypothetical protein
MRSDLIDRYKRLPPMRLSEAADRLQVTINSLVRAKRLAGLTNPRTRLEDAEIVRRYLALPPQTLIAAAISLGIGETRLRAALNRSHTPRQSVSAPKPLEMPRTPRNTFEALPPGSAETWEVLGWGKWQAWT